MSERVGFGRLPSSDERDRRFLISAAVDRPDREYRYWWSGGWWGDQGPLPHCVGYAWTHWLEDGPVTHKGQAPIVNPAELYRAAQRVDEWPGESYDGTSVRAGAKILQEMGLIAEYRWGWDLDSLVAALLAEGPVVVGTWWYAGMMGADEKGFVRATGRRLGGHAYLVNGVNVRERRLRLKNSWGRSWGQNGHAWISFDDMERLITEDGEVCLALERRPEL